MRKPFDTPTISDATSLVEGTLVSNGLPEAPELPPPPGLPGLTGLLGLPRLPILPNL